MINPNPKTEMKITLPALPSGEWQDEEGTVYAGDSGILAVVRKGQSSPIQFRGPEIEAVATAISALPDLLDAIKSLIAAVEGLVEQQALPDFFWLESYQEAKAALQKAGAVITE
jgi:hypothetical protein